MRTGAVVTAAAAETVAAVETATAAAAEGTVAAKAKVAAAEPMAGGEMIATMQRSLRPPLAEILRKEAAGAAAAAVAAAALAAAVALMPLMAAVAVAAAVGKRPGGSVARLGKVQGVMRAAASTVRVQRVMQLEMRTSRVICGSVACWAGPLGEKVQLRSLRLTVSLRCSLTSGPTLPRVVARTAAEVVMGAAEVVGTGLLATFWRHMLLTLVEIQRSRLRRCALIFVLPRCIDQLRALRGELDVQQYLSPPPRSLAG